MPRCENGRVVKGVSFVDLRDAGDPVECAAAYDRQGADELVLLDITATHEGRSTMLDIVERVAKTVFIPFTVGGGIKTVDDFKVLLRAGADKISVNSAAVRNPDLINEASYKFGAQCVVCAIDAKSDGKGGWEVYLNGGRIPTGIDAVKWAKEAEQRGAGEILLTSMDRDGQKRAMISSLHAQSAKMQVFPLSLRVEQARRSIFLTHSQSAKPMRFWRQAFSILTSFLFPN